MIDAEKGVHDVFFRNLSRKVKNYLFPPLPPETMEQTINRYRSYGITIGENCNIYSVLENGRDASLLSIGDNVTVSFNVVFLMHDNAVIKPTQGKFTDILGGVSIGNNVFIGAGSIILPGVSIADNCIIGAGSVVTKSIMQSNTVYAGNPAVYVCTTEQYVERNKNNMVNLDELSKEQVEEMIQKDVTILKRR